MSRKLRPHNDEKRMRRVPSEDKTRLDKYKHLVYNEDIYESEEFLDALDKKNLPPCPPQRVVNTLLWKKDVGVGKEGEKGRDYLKYCITESPL